VEERRYDDKNPVKGNWDSPTSGSNVALFKSETSLLMESLVPFYIKEMSEDATVRLKLNGTQRKRVEPIVVSIKRQLS